MSDNKKKNLFAQILKMISNIISWVLLVLLVIIAGFLLYYFLTTNLCKSKGGTCQPKVSLYTIVSPSMEPTIKVSDIIINLTPGSSDEISVGDIITFHSTSKLYSERIVTHRVIEKRTNEEGIVEFRTQGDNNLSPDDTYVPYQNVIGRVIFKIPQLGKLQFLLTSAGGWIFIVIVPALILVLLDVLKLAKLLNAKNRVATVMEQKPKDDTQNAQVILTRKENLKHKLINNDIKYQKGFGEPKDFYTYKPKRLKVLNDNYKYEDIDPFVEPIQVEIPEKELETFNEIPSTNELEKETESVIETQPIETEPVEKEEIIHNEENPELANILNRIQELEEKEEPIELPKLISIKKEVIPDDIDLPSEASQTKQQVVDISVAKKKNNKNGPVKVVGQIGKKKHNKNKKKRNQKRKH